MISIKWLLFGHIAFLSTHFCLSMEQAASSAWRDELYHNAFLGETFTELHGTMSIAEEIDYAETISYKTEKDFETTRPVLIMYDWLITLNEVEKKLLRKPFHLWTLDDLLFIAANLSRCTHETPSRYRTSEEHRILRDFTVEEKESYYPKLTQFLKEFSRKHGNRALPSLHMVASFYPAGAACFHTTPAFIEEELKTALSIAQTQFKEAYSQWGKEREDSFIRSASELAVAIMRIRPFPQANMRLGVVLTFIIFKQAGLVPVPVKERARYVRLALLALQLNSARPLIQYWKKALKKCPLKELLKELDTPTACLWPTSEVKVRPECIIPCDDLIRATGGSYKTDNNFSENVDVSDSDESVTTTEEVEESSSSDNRSDEGVAQEEFNDAVIELDTKTLLKALMSMKQRGTVVAVPLCNHADCLCRLRNVETEIQAGLKKEKITREAEQIKKDLAMPKLCGNCGEQENGMMFKVCSGCKHQCYCSRECQVKDWQLHKLVCFPPKSTE